MDSGEATSNEAAKALKIQPSALEGMIDLLVKKKMLSVCAQSCNKGGCGGCPVRMKKYRWVG